MSRPQLFTLHYSLRESFFHANRPPSPAAMPAVTDLKISRQARNDKIMSSRPKRRDLFYILLTNEHCSFEKNKNKTISLPFTKETFFYTQYKIAREFILTGYQFIIYLYFIGISPLLLTSTYRNKLFRQKMYKRALQHNSFCLW